MTPRCHLPRKRRVVQVEHGVRGAHGLTGRQGGLQHTRGRRLGHVGRIEVRGQSDHRGRNARQGRGVGAADERGRHGVRYNTTNPRQHTSHTHMHRQTHRTRTGIEGLVDDLLQRGRYARRAHSECTHKTLVYLPSPVSIHPNPTSQSPPIADRSHARVRAGLQVGAQARTLTTLRRLTGCRPVTNDFSEGICTAEYTGSRSCTDDERERDTRGSSVIPSHRYTQSAPRARMHPTMPGTGNFAYPGESGQRGGIASWSTT